MRPTLTERLQLHREFARRATAWLHAHRFHVEETEVTVGEKPRLLVRATSWSTLLTGNPVDHVRADGTRERVVEIRLFNCRVQWRLN